MEILISTPSDIKNIAACQMTCFPQSFAVKLGSRCVEKSLQWFFETDKRFLIHVKTDDKIVAFMGGFMPQYVGDGSKSGMLNFAFTDALLGLLQKPWMIGKAELWGYGFVFVKNKLKLLGRSSKQKNATVPAEFADYLQSVAITIIAILPEYRGKGIVDELMHFADKYTIDHHKKLLSLGVKHKNIIATKAYERNGWKIDKRIGDSYVMKKYIQG